MIDNGYDIVTIGGGIAGATLAKALAERGAKTLILESETRFRDRVRGECVASWGVAEAQRLGVYDAILAAGGHELPYWDSYQGPAKVEHRFLPATTAPKTPALSFYHPAAQEALIEAAEKAGAAVWRGAKATGIEPGSAPRVTAEVNGREVKIETRLAVGADGRTSLARQWGGFTTRRDPEQNIVAGAFLEEVPAPDDCVHLWPNPSSGVAAILFPQGGGRARAYVNCNGQPGLRLSGAGDLPRFIGLCLQSGAWADYYQPAKLNGPLASFDGRAAWVERPYRQGVALLGDAAAASDPSWGQGLSLALRDVRVLRDQLLAHEDWSAAGEAYAREHDRYYKTLHDFEIWMTQMIYQTGPEADARRAKALPLWQADPTRVPDIIHSGPDVALDETARRRFFGEE